MNPQQPGNTTSLLNKTCRLINDLIIQELQNGGLPDLVPSHGDILSALMLRDCLSMSDLADAIQRDPSTVTCLVKKLLQQGLVMIYENPQDARSSLVSLSQKGKSLQNSFDCIRQRVDECVSKDIKEEDYYQFHMTLQKIFENVSTYHRRLI